MGKLILKEFCYKPIENTRTIQIERDSEYKEMVKEANMQIEEDHIRYATAYSKAGSYLSN